MNDSNDSGTSLDFDDDIRSGCRNISLTTSYSRSQH